MGPTGSVAPTGSRESSEAAPGGIVTGPAGGAVPSPGMTLNLKPSSVISAPTSPASKGVSSFLSRATSLTGSVTSTVQQIARATSQAAAAAIKDRYKILLVIDEQLIDWSKYFRGRRLLGDWDIKVEQAEFKDITLSANSDLGAVVSIQTLDRSGFKIARTFRPDFVLVRQHVQDSTNNYSDIIMGLKYGLVPSINSLQSLYNFQDKAWVFANLLSIQRKQGKENFPLIEQTFYPTNKELSQIPRLPCVVKIGQSHAGQGKLRAENLQQYQDIRSVLLISKTYCTIEPFIDAKCDLLIQKIGSSYKAFTRKSVSGNWKANVGSSLLEQVPIDDKYKKWIDDVSEVFGGLDLCTVEAVVGKDGREYILEVCGSTMPLLGESQEEDRRIISELIMQRMNQICKNTLIKQQSRASISSYSESEPTIDQVGRQGQRPSIPSIQQHQTPPAPAGPPPPPPPAVPPPKAPPRPPVNRRSSRESSNVPEPSGPANPVMFNENNPFASPSSFGSSTTAKQAESVAPSSSGIAPSTSVRPPLTKRDSQSTVDEIKDEVDDTMRNLRKTFAGIFGDM